MKTIPTWGQRSVFSYTGSVKEGTTIIFNSNIKVTVKAEDYCRLLEHFRGRTVNIGTSRTEPPAGSVGQWMEDNINKYGLGSFVGAILLEEGYAEKVGGPEIRFFA